jgi:hypothetical protein
MVIYRKKTGKVDKKDEDIYDYSAAILLNDTLKDV